ncbi:isrso6-transposase orfb protein [Caballeronia insecticola]|uniref:Isrso6-transposase orfb protein n=1 Tax=Caballeronia insecticola TaxID=758793 RepID=R4WTW9_9BURK|nr:isrso6-transposase orfb protein [Caballeronia insecticola]
MASRRRSTGSYRAEIKGKVERFNRYLKQELARLVFIEREENVMLLGSSGVGKTHIACALALRATYAGIKTPFLTAAEFMMQLATARQQNRSHEFFNRAVMRPRLPIIDEIGYLPFGREDADLFFNVVAKRYERASIILTSNLPSTQWSTAVADDQTPTAAMLAWLLHHAHIVQISGESYRRKDKRNAGKRDTESRESSRVVQDLGGRFTSAIPRLPEQADRSD